MNKRDLKLYEAPAVEVVDAELESFVCASFNQGQGGWSWNSREADVEELGEEKD